MRPAKPTNQILQYHVPANDEGDKLADRHVRVHVRRAGRVRHAHAKLRIAGAREDAGQRGNHEAEDDARTGHVARHHAGDQVHAGAAARADAQRRQVQRREAFLL